MTRTIILFLSLILSSGLAAQERAAFIVGNGVYDYAPPLQNPTNDARLIAQHLEALEFEVFVYENLSRVEISTNLSAFLRKTEGAETTLFYFAGHGMQYEGKNFLLGTDARLRSEFDIEAEALDLDQIIRSLRRGSRAALIFVDACRNNPLATSFYQENFSVTRALSSRGLASPSTLFEGSMVTFAASPGQVAYDGDGVQPYSPFAQALARHLPAPNTEILTLMKRVIRDVKNATGARQVPMVTNDLTREIYLNLEENEDANAIAFAQERLMYEAALSLNSERAWDIFLDRYPNGQMYGAALSAQEELRARQLADQSDASVQANVDRTTSSDDARKIQAALNLRGYSAGPEDGVFGPSSRKAIADFQAAVGLPSTGVVTTGTAKALGLEITTSEESTASIYSSRNARRYDHEQLALVESDPRLIEAARLLSGKEFVYGFFEGRVYIALLQWCCDDWQQANATAKKIGGHLVTIANEQENRFVYELVAADERFWESNDDWITGPTIGLFQKEGSREPDGGWIWVTGEPNNYINWQPPFPNNNHGTASIGGFGHHLPGSQFFKGQQEFGHWDDYNNVSRSYVIEIE